MTHFTFEYMKVQPFFCKNVQAPADMAFDTVGNMFRYKPLRPGEIRLLDMGQGLSLELKHYQQNYAPEYSAVSYAWGDDDNTKEVLLNGQTFLLRSNLWSCLYYLKKFRYPFLWVDAICINQGDDGEKTAQVRIMNKIYSRAAFVSVWLGLIPYPEDIQVYGPPLLTVEADYFNWSDNIDDIANRPYWTRRWVIQEILVAKDVYIHCSDNRIHLQDFKDALCYSADRLIPLSSRINTISQSAASRKYKALPLVLARDPDRHPEIRQPLYELLLNHSDARCRDSRDIVFSLLNLVQQDEYDIMSTHFPNYSLTYDSVVIITLSYLKHFCFQPPWDAVDQDRLFRVLKIVSPKQKHRLLQAADLFDCLDYSAEMAEEFLDHSYLYEDAGLGQDAIERAEYLQALIDNSDYNALPAEYGQRNNAFRSRWLSAAWTLLVITVFALVFG